MRGAFQHLQGAGGHLQLDHGALHALVGDIRERRRVELDLVGLGEGEERTQLGLIDGLALEGAAEAGVDGESRGESERGGLGRPACER